ncbi:hypothetical protein Dsin_032161 [Dipteronia sinensis]|uniref:Uncharacterized protein n=1 Tax=Dipteronia sinensis TaxID=43782 RepID=A0AAD9ZNS0_9ROSI|nr:hypothetical protein Dsin_032161 [Dipteronia sinensis]
MVLQRKTSPHREDPDAANRRKGKSLSRPNPELERILENRLKNCLKRTIHIERDISFEKLGDTPIFQEIRRRKWETFVSYPNRGNMKLVQELYTAIDPNELENRAPVVIRKKQIFITAAEIHEYLRTRHYTQWPEGYEKLDIFKDYNQRF